MTQPILIGACRPLRQLGSADTRSKPSYPWLSALLTRGCQHDLSISAVRSQVYESVSSLDADRVQQLPYVATLYNTMLHEPHAPPPAVPTRSCKVGPRRWAPLSSKTSTKTGAQLLAGAS